MAVHVNSYWGDAAEVTLVPFVVEIRIHVSNPTILFSGPDLIKFPITQAFLERSPYHRRKAARPRKPARPAPETTATFPAPAVTIGGVEELEEEDDEPVEVVGVEPPAPPPLPPPTGTPPVPTGSPGATPVVG